MKCILEPCLTASLLRDHYSTSQQHSDYIVTPWPLAKQI